MLEFRVYLLVSVEIGIQTTDFNSEAFSYMLEYAFLNLPLAIVRKKNLGKNAI